jgi:hypothetical protein
MERPSLNIRIYNNRSPVTENAPSTPPKTLTTYEIDPKIEENTIDLTSYANMRKELNKSSLCIGSDDFLREDREVIKLKAVETTFKKPYTSMGGNKSPEAFQPD